MFDELLDIARKAKVTEQDMNEYASDLAEMIGLKISNIFERHQQEIMSLDEDLRTQIKEKAREYLEKSFVDVEDYPKDTEL